MCLSQRVCTYRLQRKFYLAWIKVSEWLGLLNGVRVCGRGMGTRWFLRSILNQTILWLHDSLILWSLLEMQILKKEGVYHRQTCSSPHLRQIIFKENLGVCYRASHFNGVSPVCWLLSPGFAEACGKTCQKGTTCLAKTFWILICVIDDTKFPGI